MITCARIAAKLGEMASRTATTGRPCSQTFANCTAYLHWEPTTPGAQEFREVWRVTDHADGRNYERLDREAAAGCVYELQD